MSTEVLPALTSLSLEDQRAKSVEKFLAARQTSGHPVTFVGSGRREYTFQRSLLDFLLSDS